MKDKLNSSGPGTVIGAQQPPELSLGRKENTLIGSTLLVNRGDKAQGCHRDSDCKLSVAGHHSLGSTAPSWDSIRLALLPDVWVLEGWPL